MTLTGARWAHLLLIATWTLTIALFTYSLVTHVREINESTYGPIPQLELTVAIGVLDLIAIVALVFAISSLVIQRSYRATH